MKFARIKFDGLEVKLTWRTQLDGAGTIEHTLTSHDPPRPEFDLALRGLVPPVVTLLGLEHAGWDDTLTVIGCSINEEDDGRAGLVVTCRKSVDLANAPLILNTPHLRERRDEELEKGFIPEELWDALMRVTEEAAQYVRGQRAQADLFAGAIG